MVEVLNNLSVEKKQAAILAACSVVSCTTDGRIRTDDPDIISIAEAFLPAGWDGCVDMMEFMQLLQSGIQMGPDRWKQLLSTFVQVEQNAYRFLLNSLIHDNAKRMITAAIIMKDCGFSVPGREQSQKSTPTNYGIEEEDESHPVTELDPNPFVRIIDTSAVRSDEGEEFTILGEYDQVKEKVRAGFSEWISKEWCPSNGMIGQICKKKQTSEGILDYVMCTVKGEYVMVIPILESGLEHIDDFAYSTKRHNNFILAHDKDGERCRKMQEGIFEKKAADSQNSGLKRIRFMATCHTKYIYGVPQTPDYVQRLITLDYNRIGSEVTLTVVGVMQPRHARIAGDSGNVLTYKDTDNPVWTYEVETNPRDNTIVRVSYFDSSRGFEYRYTI